MLRAARSWWCAWIIESSSPSQVDTKVSALGTKTLRSDVQKAVLPAGPPSEDIGHERLRPKRSLEWNALANPERS
jgi:hypothetical protein